MYQCKNCGIQFDAKREAKFCSPRCKLQAFRKSSVETDNVTLSVPTETDKFKFYIVVKANGLGRKQDEKQPVRQAVYWYDVPIAAIPVIKKGNPEMPEYMNGRQYFLWEKNDFKMNGDVPEILNPNPSKGKEEYVKAGEGSRHWGTV